MSCNINNLSDCLPKIKIGGTLGDWANMAKKNFEGLKIKDATDFFSKLGQDINHLPEDVKKAINDMENELKRAGGNFSDLFGKTLESLGEAVNQLRLPDPEKLAKKTALQLAKKYKNDNPEDEKEKLCASVIGGALATLGLSMQAASGGVPNPYANYLIMYGPAAALWGCSAAYEKKEE